MRRSRASSPAFKSGLLQITARKHSPALPASYAPKPVPGGRVTNASYRIMRAIRGFRVAGRAQEASLSRDRSSSADTRRATECASRQAVRASRQAGPSAGACLPSHTTRPVGPGSKTISRHRARGGWRAGRFLKNIL